MREKILPERSKNRGQRQRKIHHRATHRASRTGSKSGRMLSLKQCKGGRRGGAGPGNSTSHFGTIQLQKE